MTRIQTKSNEVRSDFYLQVLDLIRQLPNKEVEKLLYSIKKEIHEKRKKTSSDFQKLLLNAPTWTDKEYKNYLYGRKHFNALRSK